MSSQTEPKIVGRVLRAATQGFDFGTHSRNIEQHHNFGMFVKAPIANSANAYAFGLIYKVEIKDDLLINELVLGEGVSENILRDQRENRMIPVEVKVLTIGYQEDGYFYQSLPPRPPMGLADVELCTAEEIYIFSERQEYFRLVLSAAEVPSDDLIAAAIQHAARIRYEYRGDADYRAYLVACGRSVARNLSHDLKRLSHVLTLIRPAG